MDLEAAGSMDASAHVLGVLEYCLEANDDHKVLSMAEEGLLTQAVLDQRLSFHRSKVNVVSATPLWLACALGCDGIAKTLVQFGASINASNEYDESPLWIACKQGRNLVIELLLALPGINVDQPNYSGQTPLIAAGGQADIIRLLVEAGASLTYGTPHTGTTVLHSCSRSSMPGATTALQYLLDIAPTPAPVVGNAYGSLPVLSAAARRDEPVVCFWEHRAHTASEREQVANGWELLAAQTCNWKQSALDVVHRCWLRGVQLRARTGDCAAFVQRKREECAAVAASQRRGPLVGVSEVVEAIPPDCTEEERVTAALQPLQSLFESIEYSKNALFDSMEAAFQQCCLCSERVLGLVQKGAIRSRLVYAIWLEMQGRRQDANALLLDFMTRQLEKLAEAGCSHRFWHLCLIHIIQICTNEDSRYLDFVYSMGLETMELCALAVERCKSEGTTAARHRLLACVLHVIQLVFLSCPELEDLSGPELLNRLEPRVVNAVHRIVVADVRGMWNRTLLHLAMDDRTSQLHLSSTRTRQVALFPQPAVINLLLALGAAVNKTDVHGNLPMHLLLLNTVQEDALLQMRLMRITKRLLQAGSHLDIRNSMGKCCIELAVHHQLHAGLAPLFAELQPLPLLCLAAKAVRCRGFSLDLIFPTQLRTFVHLH